MTVHSHANYHVPKDPDASPKDLENKVFSICLIIKTNGELVFQNLKAFG